jgi:uncharacterized RmlC-like cupin family protein
MKKTIAILIVSVAGASFLAGVAIGKSHSEPKYAAMEEHQWVDLQGPKMAGLTGNFQKGGYMGLLKIPAGFTSPMHTHTGAYEAVQVLGTSSHWVKGEDGAKAKKMTPGSYWMMPAKMEHVSACAAGADCVILLVQKTKFDYKEAKVDPKAAAAAKATETAKPAPTPVKPAPTPPTTKTAPATPVTPVTPPVRK